MPSKRHFSTPIKPIRLRKKYNSRLCVAGKELNFSRRVWCEQYKSKKSTLLYETKVQFRPLAVYHIFHNTDTYSLFSLYKRGGIKSKAFETKNFEKKVKKKKNFGKKMLRRKFWKKNFEKKFEKKNFFFNFKTKILGKNFEKKTLEKKFRK